MAALVEETKPRYEMELMGRRYRLLFNPFERPVLRTLKMAGWYGLGPTKDIYGKVWDIHSVMGPLVWCTPRDTMQSWVYSTEPNRGLWRGSSTTTGPDLTQWWNVRVNIRARQDPYQIRSIKDLYSDLFTKLEVA